VTESTLRGLLELSGIEVLASKTTSDHALQHGDAAG